MIGHGQFLRRQGRVGRANLGMSIKLKIGAVVLKRQGLAKRVSIVLVFDLVDKCNVDRRIRNPILG